MSSRTENISIDQLAERYARKMHTGQTYGEGLNYVDYHLAVVVDLVKEMTDDPTVWAIAWLHDVVEDTKASHEALKSMFGEYIANQVRSLTRPKDDERQYQLQLKNAQRDAKLVKVADIVANLSNIATKKGDKKAYITEKLEELHAVMEHFGDTD